MFGAVILAAGQGTRFHSQKQFVTFQGKPVWKHSYEKTINLMPEKNVVVVGVDVEGGKTRTQSVMKGIKELQKRSVEIKRLTILEAARPLVTEKQIREILNCDQPSCTYVQPLVNTIIGKNGEYMNRGDYWAMSTPNAFNYRLLVEAFQSGKYTDLTDDTRVMYEQYYIKPHFHLGDENLFKITYPKDIWILEKLAEEMKGKLI